MKSPAELAQKLARQWENGTLREARLLDEADTWPVSLAIGKPAPARIRESIGSIRKHFDAWRKVTIGEVIWEEAKYRATIETVKYPARWMIPDAETWIHASNDKAIARQFQALAHFLDVADPDFHSLLIRRRALWRDRDPAEVEQAIRVAMKLQPDFAEGLPLRALPIAGNDTKFFERNERLLLALLDARFDGEASRQGLEIFLGAHSDRDHWLLVIDLDGSLLPFQRLRLPGSDLISQSLPGSHLLIVENETCQHHLPDLRGTIAVLGTGFDLAWTAADWLNEKHVAYWGDLDTWGLELLGRVRKHVPDLEALLMTREIYDSNQLQAVPEKTPAAPEPHPALTQSEKQLYQHLRARPKGRLEQEFLPTDAVQFALREWIHSSNLSHES